MKEKWRANAPSALSDISPKLKNKFGGDLTMDLLLYPYFACKMGRYPSFMLSLSKQKRCVGAECLH